MLEYVLSIFIHVKYRWDINSLQDEPVIQLTLDADYHQSAVRQSAINAHLKYLITHKVQ